MKARFLGKNYMGFKTGHIYDIHTECKNVIDKSLGNRRLTPFPTLCVYDNNSKSFCPYSRLETMLQNWEIIDL